MNDVGPKITSIKLISKYIKLSTQESNLQQDHNITRINKAIGNVLKLSTLEEQTEIKSMMKLRQINSENAYNYDQKLTPSCLHPIALKAKVHETVLYDYEMWFLIFKEEYRL
jgi:DNA replication protein DnaD